MSNELAKYLNSRRRFRDETAIKKQQKIAKQHTHIKTEYNPKMDQPHRYHKQHAMDCGNPKCFLCGNPRKTHKEKTVQERSFEQTDRLEGGEE